MSAEPAPAVYAGIAAVMTDIAKEGITKDRRNAQQGYNFRGIDEVYNALSPILAKHGLLMLPRVLNREVTERQTQKGGTLFFVTVEMEFTLVAASDGSAHVIKTYGEAMDSADKATNKAMSAAYKYAAMQTFCIPTEGDNDADATTHEVAPRKQSEQPRQPATLAERAATLIKAMQGVGNSADLERAWAKGSSLCAELDAKDPETLAEVVAVYEALRDAMAASTPFDKAA